MYAAVTPGAGASRTPLQALEGTITPSGLHFERHHNGVPDIDRARHHLLIHGLVNRPLTFSVAALSRYPMVSRVCFVECAGNSRLNTQPPKPPQVNAGVIHGLASCSEWTGVPLALLLDEAGIAPGAQWLLAEGADSGAAHSVYLSERHHRRKRGDERAVAAAGEDAEPRRVHRHVAEPIGRSAPFWILPFYFSGPA